MTTAPMPTASLSSSDVLRSFFAAFGRGDVEGAIDTFHRDVSITAVRKGPRTAKAIHGSYAGREGASEFLSNLGHTFDTQAFSVDHVIGEGAVAFAKGSFTHRMKTTSKLFASDWALMSVIKDSRIVEFHFFEDSAAFAEASR